MDLLRGGGYQGCTGYSQHRMNIPTVLVAQWVVHLPMKREVAGLIPAWGTFAFNFNQSRAMRLSKFGVNIFLSRGFEMFGGPFGMVCPPKKSPMVSHDFLTLLFSRRAKEVGARKSWKHPQARLSFSIGERSLPAWTRRTTTAKSWCAWFSDSSAFPSAFPLLISCVFHAFLNPVSSEIWT